MDVNGKSPVCWFTPSFSVPLWIFFYLQASYNISCAPFSEPKWSAVIRRVARGEMDAHKECETLRLSHSPPGTPKNQPDFPDDDDDVMLKWGERDRLRASSDRARKVDVPSPCLSAIWRRCLFVESWYDIDYHWLFSGQVFVCLNVCNWRWSLMSTSVRRLDLARTVQPSEETSGPLHQENYIVEKK